MKRTVIVLAVAATAATAAAQPTEVPSASATRTEVVATQPLALVAGGIGASYERQVTDHLSAVILIGFRAGAGGDYSSRTFTVGGEARWWPLSTSSRRLYVGAHASAAHTAVTDDVMDREIGRAWTLTQRLDLGWRFVVWDHLAISPTLGVVVREDASRSDRLATSARLTFALGLELGWWRRR
jgi:hypothetical protein